MEGRNLYPYIWFIRHWHERNNTLTGNCLAVPTGLEPATSSMCTVRSNQLNYKTLCTICLFCLLCLLCDSSVLVFNPLFHMSHGPILCDFVAFLATF